MKALVLHGIGDLRFEEMPAPEPGPGEVLIRVVACGVCGSDIPRIFVKEAYRYPLICGNEFSGLVTACGAGVDDLEKDARVTAFPLVWCGNCPACERGRYAQCSHYDYLGSRSDGAFAEYVVAPRRNILRVPERVPMEVAAMTEPAAVALHALYRAGGLSAGETAAIFGAGPIGLMTAQWAELSCMGKVILFDVDPDKCALARRLGFRYCFNTAETSAREVIDDMTGGEGADIVIEAAGAPAALTSCLEVAGTGARVVLLGNPASDVTLPAPLLSRAMRRELSILGSWNSTYSALGTRGEWQVVLQSMAASALLFSPLISHRVTLAHAADTLTAMHRKAGLFSKVIIQPILG